MRTNSRIALVFVTLAVLGWLAACSSLDDGDSADVVLQVASVNPSPITSSPDSADPSMCTFTVPAWSMTLNNKPKSELAITSPFNDIAVALETMTIFFDWNNPAITTPDWTIPIAGTVPANASLSLTFFPIALDELVPTMAGNSAGVRMVVRGRTGSGTGEVVEAIAATTLAVNSCQLQPIVGACCANNTCTLLRATDCIGGGGLYLGDNTTCALDPCGGP